MKARKYLFNCLVIIVLTLNLHFCCTSNDIEPVFLNDYKYKKPLIKNLKDKKSKITF